MTWHCFARVLFSFKKEEILCPTRLDPEHSILRDISSLKKDGHCIIHSVVSRAARFIEVELGVPGPERGTGRGMGSLFNRNRLFNESALRVSILKMKKT